MSRVCAYLTVLAVILLVSEACVLGGGGGCGCGCRGRKKRSVDLEWAGKSASDDDDLVCNSKHLRKVLNETLSVSPTASHDALITRLTAEEETSAVIICAAKPFIYALPTHAEYCTHRNAFNICQVIIM